MKTKINNGDAESKHIILSLSENRHPNTDGSPWGWIVEDGTRNRIATWSGYSEKEKCLNLCRINNTHADLLEALEAIVSKFEDGHTDFANDIPRARTAIKKAKP